MEPEQNHPVDDAESLKEEKNLFSRATLSIGFSVLVVAIILTAYIFIAKQQKASQNQVPLPEQENFEQNPSVVFGEGTYTSNYENLTFKVPVGWRPLSLASTTLPKGVQEVWFLIEEPISGCVIAGGDFEYELFETHKQVSFADRIFSNTYQFDGSWYVPIDGSPDSLVDVFSGDSRLYQEGEIRVSVNLSNPLFMLWQKDGTSVQDECNTALNELLATVEPYYEQRIITQETEGYLSITESLRLSLYTGETYNTMLLPEGIAPYGTFLVYKNKIFSLRQASPYAENQKSFSEVVSIDPVASSVTPVQGTYTDGTFISSLYIHNDILYFIRGDREYGSCLSGYAECFGNLYGVAVAGGEPKLLVERIKGDTIIGYSQVDDALYFRYGRGDAGCGSVTYIKVDLRTNMQFEVGKAGGCYNEDGTGMEEYEALIASVSAKLLKTKTTSLINIDKGALKPTEEEIDDSYNSFIFVEEANEL